MLSWDSNSAATLIPDADTADGFPVWDEHVQAVLKPATGLKLRPFEVFQEGHLGWDKTKGTSLGDPTITTIEALAPAGLPEAGEKYAYQDQTHLTFRSRRKQIINRGLDPNWINQVRTRNKEQLMGLDWPERDPVFGVIQFRLPFDTQARYELEGMGVRFYNYVKGGGLYARVPDSALSKLQSLFEDGRVHYAGFIPMEARLETTLAVKAETEPEAVVQVTVQFFDVPTTTQIEAVKKIMSVKKTSLHPALPILEGELLAKDALLLAGWSPVRWVELRIPKKPNNLESTMSLATDVIRQASFISDGREVQVAIIDSGIANPAHTDLPLTRILDQWEYFPNNDAVAEDSDTHGTHVAGTIGGGGTLSSEWQGHAPAVNFLIYKLCCDQEGYGYHDADFQDSLERASTHGVDIANNSFGGVNGVYDTTSEIVDRAVRGEYGRYINMVISAGNDNDRISTPGTAKNGITVGALKDGNWTNQELTFTKCSDTNWPPGERVCFSNYGPLDIDGNGRTRVKPDVMATGVRVYSTVPGGSYTYKNGTSMSAPAVSGAIAAFLSQVADVYSWLFDWPETIKAMILATAVDVGGNTNLYGRGLLDLYHLYYSQVNITAPIKFWGEHVRTTAESKNFTFYVPANFNSIRVALTWPDPAGSTEVANDLDLYIYANSTCTGATMAYSTSFDDPVEWVKIEGGPSPATWCAKVKANSLSSSQSFGLAIFIDLKPPALTVEASTSRSFIMPDQTFFYYTTLSNSGNTAGGSYSRIRIPMGFSLVGARLYSDDGRSHFYSSGDLYTDGTYWRIATGALLNAHPRVVRWSIRVNRDTEPGHYWLDARGYYRQEGSFSFSPAVYTPVTVGPAMIYLPLIRR